MLMALFSDRVIDHDADSRHARRRRPDASKRARAPSIALTAPRCARYSVSRNEILSDRIPVPQRGRRVSVGVAAVQRALALLDAFGEQDRALTLAQLAARTGFYKSTILRLAASLEQRGYLVRLPDRGWRLGPAVSRLGAAYQAAFDLGDLVEPALQRLVRDTGETAAFHVRDGKARVSLYRVESPQRIRDHVRPGEHLPRERGAGGRVLLAFSGAKGAEYDRIRRTLSFHSFGDRVRELGGLSVPGFGVGQRLAGALTVSAPLSRFDRRAAARIEPLVRAEAAALTRLLGGDAAVYGEARPVPRAPAWERRREQVA
jgi:DNA-binding IclR family transcriptional regulator